MKILTKKKIAIAITFSLLGQFSAAEYRITFGNSHYENSIVIEKYQEPESITSESEEELPQKSSEWLTFIQSHGDLLDITELSDWSLSRDAYNNQGLARISGSQVTDESIPQGSLGVADIYRLQFSGTSITNLNFMQGVKTMQIYNNFVNGTLENIQGLKDLNPSQPNVVLQLQNNQITSLEGLNQITEMRNINASNNSLTNVDALSSLTITENVNISGNASLVDISGLANIRIPINGYYGSYPIVRFDSPSQYTTKIPEASNFCIDLAAFDFADYEYPVKDKNSTKIPLTDICG